MSLPQQGRTYRFKCAASSTRRLNLYSSGTAADGMNVVLYDPDETNEQKWYYRLTSTVLFLYSKLKSHKIGLWSDAFKKGAEMKFL